MGKGITVPGEDPMKNSVLLTIFSLLTILLLILHLTTEIAFGLESGGLKNIMGILVVVVWLSGTLLLYERKLGYVIVLVGSLLGTVVPIIHMMGAGLVGGRIGHTHLALFWVFSNFLLGVTALFSVMLSVRGLWSLRRTTPSMRRPVDVKTHFFFLLSFSLFPFS
jgi:hypothetical protein